MYLKNILNVKAMGPPPHDDSVWEEVLEHLFGCAINNELQSSQESKPSSSENKKDKDSVESKVKRKAGKTTQSNDKEKLPKGNFFKNEEKAEEAEGQSKDLESTAKKN